jgi:predicted RNase H-like HicB family nuclease
MKTVIRISIKEYNDFTHPYFLVTSPEVEGVLVAGRAVEEVMKLVPEVLNNLLVATKERLEKQVASLISTKAAILKYDYEQSFNFQLA